MDDNIYNFIFITCITLAVCKKDNIICKYKNIFQTDMKKKIVPKRLKYPFDLKVIN